MFGDGAKYYCEKNKQIIAEKRTSLWGETFRYWSPHNFVLKSVIDFLPFPHLPEVDKSIFDKHRIIKYLHNAKMRMVVFFQIKSKE